MFNLGCFDVLKAGFDQISPPWVPLAASRAWRRAQRGNDFRMKSDNTSDQRHIPVLLHEVLEAMNISAGDRVLDATFGAGGYSRAMLEAGASVLALDRDPEAIADGQPMVDEWSGKLNLVQGRFSALDALAKSEGFDQLDAVVADIGVSSMQIDQAERGFSFQKDGPLDMRMEQAGVSAADVVNTFERPDLTRIIGILGDERHASRVSAAIVKRRETEPFETTLDLASVIEKVLGRKQSDKIHPATKSFQALRIYVNQELEELADALLAAERILKPGGRLVIVTFHSLEDRLVKRFMQDRAEQGGGSRHLPPEIDKTLTFTLPRRGAVSASKSEVELNPRSRSAKLRAGIRTDVSAESQDRAIFGLPRLADISPRKGRRGDRN